MDRFDVLIAGLAAGPSGDWPDSESVRVAPGVLEGLGLLPGESYQLRYGRREARVSFQPDPSLAQNRVNLPVALAEQLCLEGSQGLSLYRTGPQRVALGPLIGVFISRSKLQAVLDGQIDTVYGRYAEYAREAGAVLFFFSDSGLQPEQGTVQGYQLQGDPWQGWRWIARRFPIPRVIYDRCFGREGREEARRLRELVGTLHCCVVNHAVKITKLQTFAALGNEPELAPHLPFTAPLTPEGLAEAMASYSDLYLKPDALYKGQGIYRLSRQAEGWLLQSREEWGNASQPLSDWREAVDLLAPLLDPAAGYLMQEGLPLATYLGNRFDFRSLVQKNGRNEWVVTGLVARVAPAGSVITSPRSGGRVAPADQALSHFFPDRWEQILDNLYRLSRQIAEGIERHQGPCIELGLDVGVVEDGTVKLIEVNGRPLKVSLTRLHDPRVAEGIYRHPIHAAAALDVREVEPCAG